MVSHSENHDFISYIALLSILTDMACQHQFEKGFFVRNKVALKKGGKFHNKEPVQCFMLKVLNSTSWSTTKKRLNLRAQYLKMSAITEEKFYKNKVSCLFYLSKQESRKQTLILKSKNKKSRSISGFKTSRGKNQLRKSRFQNFKNRKWSSFTEREFIYWKYIHTDETVLFYWKYIQCNPLCSQTRTDTFWLIVSFSKRWNLKESKNCIDMVSFVLIKYW